MGGIILAYRYKIEIEVDEKKIKTENNSLLMKFYRKKSLCFCKKQGIDEDKSVITYYLFQ